MDYATTLGLALIILSSFLLGRCSLCFKMVRLKKENRMLRNLLDKVLRLEELSSRTYGKIARQYTGTGDELDHAPKQYTRRPTQPRREF